MPDEKKKDKALDAAERMGGETAPPAKKKEGNKPGPRPRWEPEPGKQYKAEDVHVVELELEREDLSEAERNDFLRRIRIMQRRLKLEEFEMPLRFLSLPVPRLAARITGWRGWTLTEDQADAIVKAGAPAMREIWPSLVSGRGGIVAAFAAALFDIFDHKLDGYLEWRKTQKGGGDGGGTSEPPERRE